MGKHMSFSSPESDFVAPRANDLFAELDTDSDGVLSRDEVSKVHQLIPVHPFSLSTTLSYSSNRARGGSA